MITSTDNDNIRTVAIEKNTWILEVPEEVCVREGFAKGTLVSLTIKDGAISSTFIARSADAQRSVKRFSAKYGDFMKEIAPID
jgi:hypothetical protein